MIKKYNAAKRYYKKYKNKYWIIYLQYACNNLGLLIKIYLKSKYKNSKLNKRDTIISKQALVLKEFYYNGVFLLINL